MTLRSSILVMLTASVALTGCNLAPKYVRPIGAVPAALPQGGVYPTAPTDAPDVTKIGWRDFFVEDRLRQVIALGLDNNRDLRLAAANVLQARAQYGAQHADLLPTINANGSSTYTNTAAQTAGFGGIAGGSSSDISTYSANVGFSSFEIDLFGRIRNQTKAAQEAFFASEEAQRSARISLIAEIASAWLTMASDHDQLRLSRETLKAFEQTLSLTRAQFRIGVASELEARQAETNYQSARNDIALLSTRIAQDQNALNLLVGATVDATLLPSGLDEGDAMVKALPGNLSSDVLLRRPDVLEAEHKLIAQNANIGVARAAFFPKLSLTATLGTISPALSGLFGSGTGTYNASPALSLPLFDAGRNRNNLRAAKAAQQGAVATYEKTIQTAFREVADALAQRGTIDEQVSAQTARAEAARIAARLSQARYTAGIDSFLVSLDAQRTSYAAQQQLVTTRLNRGTNLVELYRSLGGGL